jgi:hypothetical protein
MTGAYTISGKSSASPEKHCQNEERDPILINFTLRSLRRGVKTIARKGAKPERNLKLQISNTPKLSQFDKSFPRLS